MVFYIVLYIVEAELPIRACKESKTLMPDVGVSGGIC